MSSSNNVSAAHFGLSSSKATMESTLHLLCFLTCFALFNPTSNSASPQGQKHNLIFHQCHKSQRVVYVEDFTKHHSRFITHPDP